MEAPPDKEKAPAEGLPEQEFARLMQSVETAAPLLRGLAGRGGGAENAPAADTELARREALVCALKPYLSPARREAAEYLLRLWRLGEALKGLR